MVRVLGAVANPLGCGLVSEEERISATRRISAPAATIFAIVTDPAGQVAIDGSHMLVAASDAARLEAVGDAFSMDMDREALGDLPMGEYTVLNTVTKFEQDRVLEWNVGSAERGPFGHVYGYALDPVDEHMTDVTSYCDWSGISDVLRERIAHWPVVPKMALITTLEKLDALATSSTELGCGPRPLTWGFPVETMGLEPTTSCLQSRCSSQLSYVPGTIQG